MYSGKIGFAYWLILIILITSQEQLLLLLLISDCCPLSKLDYSYSIIIIITLSLVTGAFFLALLLKHVIPTVQASSFRLHAFVTSPVAVIVTGIITYFMWHTHCISTHKLLYFSFFSASLCATFLSDGIVTSISMHVFFCFELYIRNISHNFSTCVYPLIPWHWHIFM